MDSIVVRVEGIAPVSADDAAAVADLLCSLDGVQKSDFTVSSVDNKGETATARISCSGADVAEALVQKIHGEYVYVKFKYYYFHDLLSISSQHDLTHRAIVWMHICTFDRC